MSYPQHGKQENELGTEIVMVLSRKPQSTYWDIITLIPFLKEEEEKRSKRQTFKTLSVIKQITDKKKGCFMFLEISLNSLRTSKKSGHDLLSGGGR